MTCAWSAGRPEHLFDVTGWKVSGSRIQRVMIWGDLRRAGLLFLTEARPPKEMDVGCSLGIRADLSKAWRIAVADCERNYVDVKMTRKSDGVVVRAAVTYIPPRGSVNYSAAEMQANFERTTFGTGSG